jgi:hypothetical protein
MGSGGGESEAAREVKRRAATLDKPAAAGVPRHAGAQRAGAEGRGMRRGQLMRGPGRAGERGEADGWGRGRKIPEKEKPNFKNLRMVLPGLQNSPNFY